MTKIEQFFRRYEEAANPFDPEMVTAAAGPAERAKLANKSAAHFEAATQELLKSNDATAVLYVWR